MANDINSHCVVCDTGYHCCLSCGSRNVNSWRLLTDTSEHFKIYLIVCDFRDNKITKEDALQQLKNIDITGLESFNEGVKNLIKTILDIEQTLPIKEEVKYATTSKQVFRKK